jgi:predicted ATPase
MTSPALPPESDVPFLDQVLEPLLEDFAASFERGFQLLENCPEAVLPLARQLTLMGRLETARRELAAARALRAAAPVPMALEMATITPWHELVVEVWTLSAALRAA